MNEELIPQPDTTPKDAPPEDAHTVIVPPRGGFVRMESTVYEGNKVSDNAVALIISLALTGIVVTSALSEWDTRANSVRVEDGLSLAIVPEGPARPSSHNPFDTVYLDAQAVAVYDVMSGKLLYARGADQVRPLASLTKIMTGLVAYEAVGENQSVTITPYAIETEGDSGLFAHETWRLGDLLSFMLVTSSNDGADAIAAAVGNLWDLEDNSTDEYLHVETFVDTMNRKATEIGMKETKFTNPSGLDESGTYGGLGTAEDVARMLAYTWEHAPTTLVDTIEAVRTYTSRDGFVHTATNTNGHVGTFPGLLGSKTGYTERAGANLAVIYDAGMNHPVVVVVLGSSREGRFADVSKLTHATNAYIMEGWYSYEVAGSTPTI